MIRRTINSITSPSKRETRLRRKRSIAPCRTNAVGYQAFHEKPGRLPDSLILSGSGRFGSTVATRVQLGFTAYAFPHDEPTNRPETGHHEQEYRKKYEVTAVNAFIRPPQTQMQLFSIGRGSDLQISMALF
jgi:hypothetical protein